MPSIFIINEWHVLAKAIKLSYGKKNYPMNWRDVPSFSGLRAFAEVARTGSYTEAARNLNVTRAAVGQQIRRLENRQNVKLVERSGRGIRLTDKGAAFAEKLETAFQIIKGGLDEIAGTQDNSPVRITMSPAFAVEWLLPRLPEFEREHPDIKFHLNATAEIVELGPGGADIAIRYQDVSRARAGAATVLVSDMVVLAAEGLVRGVSSKPKDLANLPWLQELGTSEVIEWFRRRSIHQPGPLRITEMPGNMIMQALRRGDGLSYTSLAFFEDEVRRGELTVLHSEPLVGYYCVEVGAAAQRSSVKQVVKWLMRKSQTVTQQESKS